MVTLLVTFLMGVVSGALVYHFYFTKVLGYVKQAAAVVQSKL